MSTAENNQDTDLWKSCWYPWLNSGWIKCVCGKTFHSNRDTPATIQHAQHAKEAHGGT